MQQQIQMLKSIFLPLSTNLETKLLTRSLKKSSLNLKIYYSRKELLSLFLGRTTSWNIFKELLTFKLWKFYELGNNSNPILKQTFFQQSIALSQIYCL